MIRTLRRRTVWKHALLLLAITFMIFSAGYFGGELVRPQLRSNGPPALGSTRPSPGDNHTSQEAEEQKENELEIVELGTGASFTDCTALPLSQFSGSKPAHKRPTSKEKLNEDFPFMKDGHYSPRHCEPPQKLAILIPYRDRRTHLYTLLPTILSLMVKQGLDFTIFVVEQELPTSFNKGVVYNAGFLEALKLGDFDCFIFHDVDMLPLNDRNFYQCDARGPVHFVAGVNKFQYKLMYQMLIGGVLGFTREQYQRVNGFSNLYFGWGSEDDDMAHRIASVGMNVWRRPKPLGLYDMIIHRRDKRWSPNMGRFEITKHAAKRTQVDGLNTVKYTLTHMQKTQLYVHIRISVDMTQVYNTAPEYMKDIVWKARLLDLRSRVKDGTDKEIMDDFRKEFKSVAQGEEKH